MTAAYSSIVNVAYATRVNTTINVPASTANGNLLLMGHVTAAGGGAPPQALPAGWTQIGSRQVAGGSFEFSAVHAYRIAASEPASYTLTHSSGGASGWIMRITGAGTLSVDVSSQNATVGAALSTPTIALSVTPTAADDLLVFSSLNWDAAALTPPTGMTERQDSQILYLATQALASASATGNKTQAQASTPWFGNLYAIKDVTAGGGGGTAKVRIGAAWVAKPVKIWSGSAWVSKPVKVWSGSAWVVKG